MTEAGTALGRGAGPHGRGSLTGSVLDGRYRIGSVIARGGMSTVYRGLDMRLDRPVAVKVMAAQYAHDQAFLARFSREARLAAGLSHPGIVAVHDHGRDGDHAFLVMELVDGGTLRDLLHQRGPLPVPVAVAILEPLLHALAAAHAAGLVHRDVKPENVLISARGEVKVADFGLVRAVTSHTVATGDVILGTVAYLSPEQVSVGRSDARSDVYSAGIVAWEMLVGEPPFTGENAMSVAYQHVHQDVPLLSEVVGGVPGALEDLIGDATQRDPELRPRDAGEFAEEVAELRDLLRIPRVAVPVPVRPDPVAPTDDPDADIPLAGRTGGHRRTRSAPVGPDGGPHWSQAAAATRSDHRATAAAVGPGGTRVVPGSADRATAGGRADELGRPAPVAGEPGRRRRRFPRWLAILLVMLLLGVAAAAGGWWLVQGRWTTAPATTGMTMRQAEQAVRDAGLVPQITVATTESGTVGAVAAEQPVGGSRVLRGSPVALVVSAGRPSVPAVRAGTTTDVARALLTDAGLTTAIAPQGEFSAEVPFGRVVRTDPAAGRPVRPGMTVTLVLSRGRPLVTVPAVAGKTGEDARNALLVADVVPSGTTPGFSADSPDGTVLGTRPAAGQRVSAGSPVVLVVNTSLTVPDVRGRDTAAAAAALTAQGFRVTTGDPVFAADVDGGAVAQTEPAAGTRLDPADPVVVLHASSAITVPDLTTGSVEQAGGALASLGLQLRVRGWLVFAGSRVSSQDPAAGSRIEPGGTVTVNAGW